MTGSPMYRLIAILLLSVLILGCSQKTLSEADQAVSPDSLQRPDSEVTIATIYLYDREKVTSEIRAELIRRYESIDSTMAYVLDVDFLDSLGQVSSNVIGDSGVIKEQSGKLRIYGNVVVVTQDSSRLETDYLTWDPNSGKIESDAFVKFTRGDNIMTGWGMEADPDLGRLKILRDVSGSVTESEVESEK